LHPGQTQAFGLRPEARDVAQVFGVGADLLEEPPGGLDGGQILFALIFAAAFFQQAVFSPDPLHGFGADR
jgi:hypothetical protein